MLVQHSKILSSFKRFCAIAGLHTSNFHYVEQMNQKGVWDNRKSTQEEERWRFVRDNQGKDCQLHLSKYVLEETFP